MFNLEGLIQLAQLGEYFGNDLWNYSTTDGRSIRKVIDWLSPFALGEKKWRYKQITPLEQERMYPILQIAAVKYRDTYYADAAKRISDKSNITPLINLLYRNYNE